MRSVPSFVSMNAWKRGFTSVEELDLAEAVVLVERLLDALQDGLSSSSRAGRASSSGV